MLIARLNHSPDVRFARSLLFVLTSQRAGVSHRDNLLLVLNYVQHIAVCTPVSCYILSVRFHSLSSAERL